MKATVIRLLPRINTVAFGHSADSALDFRCHLKQLADVGQVLSQVCNDSSVFAR